MVGRYLAPWTCGKCLAVLLTVATIYVILKTEQNAAFDVVSI